MRIMMKYVGYFICMVMLFVLPVMRTNADTVTKSTYVSPVEITDYKMNKKSFKKGDKIKYSMTIKDIGINDYLAEVGKDKYWNLIDEIGGVYGEPPYYHDSDAVYLYWKSSKKQYVVQSYPRSEADKEKGELKISNKIPVKKGMQKGTWRLVAIYFSYDEEVFCVKDTREMEEDDESPVMDFSAMDFKVTGTGKADKKAPTLDLKSLKLSKTSVKKKQKSTFSIKIKDASKIEEVVCIWDIYDKANKGKAGDYSEIYRMKYNKKTKQYQCSVKLDTKYESKAQLVGIEVRDIYGNEKNYYAYKHKYGDADYDKKVSKYYNAYKNMTVKAKK